MSFVLFKKTRMYDAIRNGDILGVTELLDKDVSPNIPLGENRVSPLTVAIRHGRSAIAILLIQRGANLNTKPQGYFLHLALSHDNVNVVAQILERVPTMLDKQFGDPWLFCSVESQSIEIAELLLKKKPELIHEKVNGNTVLHYAVRQNDYYMVDFLIQKDSDLLPQKNQQGNTAFHYAAANGSVKIATLLLDKCPALLSAVNEAGSTALHNAVSNGRIDMVIYLLSKGLDPRIRNNNHETALSLAQAGEDTRMIDILSQANASFQEQVETGWKMLSPGMVACIKVQKEISYRMTEVFNFEARERVRIVQNLITKAEAVESKNFDDIAEKAPLEEAFAQLIQRGGTADYGSISGLLKGKSAPGKTP